MELLQSDTSGKIPKFPLVAIADSLKMGDDAVNMCSQSNVESIICLGVDFMSESVSAILGKNGFSKTPGIVLLINTLVALLLNQLRA